MMVNKERRALSILARQARRMAEVYQAGLDGGEISEIRVATRFQDTRDALIAYAEAIEGTLADPEQWDGLVQDYQEHMARTPDLGRGAELRH
jgi:hypothetical protein